jgi:hypothetical protein
MLRDPDTAPQHRSAAGRALNDLRWARVTDRSAATQKARDARWRKLEDRVDPDRVLTAGVRYARAAQLQRAEMQALVLRRHSRKGEVA